MHDRYWDTAELKLIAYEAFLRERDGRFELKLPLHKLTRELPKAYHYREIYDEAEIRRALKLPSIGTLGVSLQT